jgi:uncharacterized integral membrane protein
MSEPVPASRQRPRADGRIRRGVRHTHRMAYYLAVGVVLATIAYLILLIVRNTRQVKLDYVFGSAHARLIWLIVVSAFTGWLLGLATAYLNRRRARRPR